MEQAGSIRSSVDIPRLRAGVSLDALGESVFVHDAASNELVGACRMVPPRAARRAGGYAAGRLFDLAQLDLLRERMVELTGPTLHPHGRRSAVMHALWGSIARYLVENRYDYLLATTAMSVSDGGHAAASAFRALGEAHLSPIDLRAIPRERLPLESLRDFLQLRVPADLRTYVGMGAWVCGEPALDARFGIAAFPLLLPLARMRAPYARHFLSRAA